MRIGGRYRMPRGGEALTALAARKATGTPLLIHALPAWPLAWQAWFAFPIGGMHGIAVAVYVALMAIVLTCRRVGVAGGLRILLAAFVPFGTFFNDAYLCRLAPTGRPG